jgi:diacylglycerol kinase family enzyme
VRALVVVNPQATTTSARARDVVLSALRHDLKLEVVHTSYRGHAVEVARQARLDELDVVIALGGDGTVNEVVNGLLADGTRPPLPDLAVVPGGSTNVLARNLGIPPDQVEATGLLLDAIREDRRRYVGLGRLDSRWFTFCAGIGLDADVTRAVEEARARGASASVPLYLRTAVRRYFAQEGRRGPGPITLERPGAEPVTGIHVAIVGNASPWTYLGPRGVHPTPRAEFDTGLDLLALTRLRLPSTLRHVAVMLAPGDHSPRGRDVVELHDQDGFVLTSERPVPVQVDGDYVGDRTRIELVAAPRALRLVV